MERKRLAIASAEAAPGTATLSTALSIDLPQKVTTENLSEIFSKLAAAVPDTVGHDQRARVQDRNVIQGAMRVVEAIRDYAPQNPWERGSPLLEEAERVMKARSEARGDKKKERFQKNTPLETRIARSIYPDRRRAHVASAVIREAFAAGKTADELLEFIEQSKGMEAIRRKTGGVKADDALELMWKTKPLGTILLARELAGNQTVDLPKVMLFTVRPTGEVDIRWVGENTPTARSALAAFARSQKDKSVFSHDTSEAVAA